MQTHTHIAKSTQHKQHTICTCLFTFVSVCVWCGGFNFHFTGLNIIKVWKKKLHRCKAGEKEREERKREWDGLRSEIKFSCVLFMVFVFPTGKFYMHIILHYLKMFFMFSTAFSLPTTNEYKTNRFKFHWIKYMQKCEPWPVTSKEHTTQ